LPGEAAQDGADLFAADGTDLPAADSREVGRQLKRLGKLLTNPGTVPALVVAAVVHAELAVVRPFVAGNGMVARAMSRAVLVGRGVEGTGIAVWEAPLLAMGPRYPLTLAGFDQGEDAAAAWVQTFAESVVEGVAEGSAVCDAVLSGRLRPA
jgi:hypothetical protein